MVSIIIASADPQLLQQVKVNINETLGLPYEILAFDNAGGAKSICEIYNQGIRQAKHAILCFMHEDIAFKTTGWGKRVQDIFKRHPEVGVIGIAGSTYKSVMPTGWASHASPESERSNLLQSFRYMEWETVHDFANPGNEQLAKVVTVDGAWMCVKKEVTEKFQFDSTTFKKFHCYDLDFCLSAGKGYEIGVTYEILLHHFSEGSFDKEWMEQTLLLYQKWEGELPRSTLPLAEKKIRKIEKQNFKHWMKQMLALGFKKKMAYRLLHRPRLYKILGLKYFLKLHYSIFACHPVKEREKNQRL